MDGDQGDLERSARHHHGIVLRLAKLGQHLGMAGKPVAAGLERPFADRAGHQPGQVPALDKPHRFFDITPHGPAGFRGGVSPAQSFAEIGQGKHIDRLGQAGRTRLPFHHRDPDAKGGAAAAQYPFIADDHRPPGGTTPGKKAQDNLRPDAHRTAHGNAQGKGFCLSSRLHRHSP